ncbi:MAG TPA: hypothetical protein VHO69_05570 [Phototrophicaceae bacterium]|nr:hypothetical protein [Phototrophicaceae bacterium]
MERIKKAAMPIISLGVGLVLVFQAAVTFRLLCPPARFGWPQLVCEPAGWPFVHYPMYSLPHYPGETLNQYSVYGLLPNGREVMIQPQDLGLTVFQFPAVVEALLTEDRALIKTYVTAYHARVNRQLSGLRLENKAMVLGKDGWQDGKTEIIKQVEVD